MKRQIWKIPLLIILLIAFLLSFSACLPNTEKFVASGKNSTELSTSSQAMNNAEITATAPSVSNAEVTDTAPAVSNAAVTASTQAAKQAVSESFDILTKIPDTFTFTGGTGGWETSITINKNGTFSGLYTDDDMGDTGDGYPNGTRYECQFNGKFTDIKKISDKEYYMRIEYLHTEETAGEEKIIDGVKIVTSTPYGFDNAGEFRLYLPGRSITDLSKEFLDWIPLDEVPSELPLYGLYNVDGEEGFYADGSN